MAGARGLLINITGGDDLTLFEVDQAANRIREEVDEEANVIFGSAIDESLSGRIRVSVVATGIDSPRADQQRPRLVAVGGGAMPAPQPIVNPATSPGPAVAPIPLGGGAALRQVSPAPVDAVTAADAAPAMEPAGDTAPHGALHQVAQPTPLRTHAAGPHPAAAAPAARTGLFPDPNRPSSPPPVSAAAPMAVPETPKQSLFNAVTGAFRRNKAAPSQPAIEPQLRREVPQATMTEIHPQATAPSVRQAHASDEVGLEIPAFLRRQSS
jgi:cell division protein FtsZ